MFAYFTGEIFERARPNNQRTLLLSALLPSVTGGDAAAITGDADAPRVLDYLYRQHLFTDRRRTAAIRCISSMRCSANSCWTRAAGD